VSVERHREELNRLNVYPVPDGDTGDNLAAMMESVTARMANSTDVAEAIASGALHGGRGSSGVIMGQALRGFVASLPSDARGPDAGGLGYVLFLDALAEVLTGTASPPLELPATDPRDCGAARPVEVATR
jgi:dihydroxyacetone kinase-like predicted kinase